MTFQEPNHTLLAGMTGCGKTTWVNTLLLNNRAAACRFIYDDLNRMWPRLKIPVCHTREQLEISLASRWSAFNPNPKLHLFGGNPRKAFDWWCRWVFNVATRGPGKKIVCVPEAWRFCNEESIVHSFAALANAGREIGIELVCDTQNPEKMNSSIIGNCTEIVIFRLMAKESVRSIREILKLAGIPSDADTVAALCQQPMGSFVAFNRQGGGRIVGHFDFQTGEVFEDTQ